MHDWCAKDANNKVFPFLLAFLPSKAQWAYTFVCRAAGALNLGPSLCRTIKINSDADKQETWAICNAIGKNRKKRYVVALGRQNNNDVVLPVYKKQQHSPPLSSLLSTLTSNSDTRILPNAHQGWCGFHKVDRNLTSNVEYRGLLDAARDKDIFGNVEIDVIVRWMWYFIKYYRNMEEVEMSAFFFNYYMTEEDQSDHITNLEAATRSKIVEFLCKSFFVHSDMLFESCFEGMTMENVTTSINEAWHRATKRVAGGPRPKHDLAESAKRINKRTEQNETTKAKKAAFDATSIPAKSDDRKRHSRALTDYCNRQLDKEYKSSRMYVMFRCGENSWFVKRNYEAHPTTVDEDLGDALNHCQNMLDTMLAKIDETDYAVEIKTIRDLKAKLLGTKKGNLPEYRAISNDAIKYVVPRYERTHIVKIETMTSGEKVLTCGNDKLGIPCRFTKHGQACRHMYHLLERTPTIRDAVVRWHVAYAHFYGKNDEMT